MKLGAITCAFNEERFIKPCIEQFDGFDIDHLILVSKRPWFGDYEMDKTWLLAKTQEAVNPKVNVVVDYWATPHDQFNYGLDLMWKTAYDWVFIVDCDEFYTAQNLGSIIGELKNTKADAISVPYMHVYWRTPEYRIIPRQSDNPIIAIRPGRRFHDIREVDSNTKVDVTMAEMHHMSYVRDDEQMLKKINCFYHAPEFDTQKWYEEVWRKWNPDMQNLHPTQPHQFKQAIYNPAPAEILRLLDA